MMERRPLSEMSICLEKLKLLCRLTPILDDAQVERSDLIILLYIFSDYLHEIDRLVDEATKRSKDYGASLSQDREN
jgi:hypothetical protein